MVLSDKALNEGAYSFKENSVKDIQRFEPLRWNGERIYKRYSKTPNGVSPFVFLPNKKAIVKVNSYEHDEYGITTEDPIIVQRMCEKRLAKERFLLEELDRYEAIKIYGDRSSKTAILCWGSNKGVCIEVGLSLGMKVIQPIVLSPFPLRQFLNYINGVERLIVVENNATGQLGGYVGKYGVSVDGYILKFDGRPFYVNELKKRVEELI